MNMYLDKSKISFTQVFWNFKRRNVVKEIDFLSHVPLFVYDPKLLSLRSNTGPLKNPLESILALMSSLQSSLFHCVWCSWSFVTCLPADHPEGTTSISHSTSRFPSSGTGVFCRIFTLKISKLYCRAGWKKLQSWSSVVPYKGYIFR